MCMFRKGERERERGERSVSSPGLYQVAADEGEQNRHPGPRLGCTKNPTGEARALILNHTAPSERLTELWTAPPDVFSYHPLC